MRVLRICNSADLPPLTDLDSNYIYYTYDNMEIYIGRSRFYDHYCIVEKMPENPVSHMLYITMRGDVKTCIDNAIIDIAEIEDESQIQYLNLVGSTFFMKAEYRYLDLQTRTIQLPYQNGTYMLSTSMANDITIDKDTVISYDETKGHFVIDGNLENSEELRRISTYKGSETDTATTSLRNGRIFTDVKVSDKYYNILKVVGDGLHASVEGLATSDEVHLLANTYYNFKREMLYYIQEIQEGLENIDSISEDTLNAKIVEALEDYVPTVADIVDNYEIMYNQLGILTQSMEDYADEKFDALYQEVVDYFLDLEIKWRDFTDITGEPESEPDEAYSQDEVDVRNMIMEEFNKQLIVLRRHAHDEMLGVLFSIITDEDHFNDITTHNDSIRTLIITSTPGTEYKYTSLSVSPDKLNDINRYFYAVDIETYPVLNQKLDVTVYTEWNGTDELKIEYGKSIVIVETNSFRRAIRYGLTQSNANRG